MHVLTKLRNLLSVRALKSGSRGRRDKSKSKIHTNTYTVMYNLHEIKPESDRQKCNANISVTTQSFMLKQSSGNTFVT